MDKQTRKILVRARELIATPEKWTKGSYARNKMHSSVDYTSASAVCFCTSGAIRRARAEASYDENITGSPIRTLARYEPIAERNGIAYWNDMADRSHSDVLALFDRALFDRAMAKK